MTADDRAFEIQTEQHDGYISVVLMRARASVGDLWIQTANLREGRARSGDGAPLTGDGPFEVILYVRDQIDLLTLKGDYVAPFSTSGETAVFAVHRTAAGKVAGDAAALHVRRDEEGKWHVGEQLDGQEALDHMSDIGATGDQRSADTPLQSSAAAQDIPPYFTELHVEGYRGFAERRILKLARPTGAAGSGMTIVVGANNSGKSSFLEALAAIAKVRTNAETTFSQPRRHRDLDSVEIELHRSDMTRINVRSIRTGGSQAQGRWLPEGAEPSRYDIHTTPSRRSFNPYFSSMGYSERNWSVLEQEYSRTQLRDSFVGRLRTVDRDPVKRVAFDHLLERIIGAKLDWTFDEIATGQQFMKLIESDGSWHTSEGLGDGLVSLLFIVDALYDSEPGSLIAIDEPELSLHPQLIRRLARVLSDFASDRQVLIATHSPHLVDWSDIENGATVARVFKVKGRSEIAQPSPDALKAVAKLSGRRNLRNPHTIGTSAMEAFFLEDGVILLEGQDDVAYLPRVLEDLGLPPTDNVYGWGGGGVGNLPVLAALFLGLGFSRVGVIVDDDEQEGTKAAVQKLEDMGPKVLVRAIPAPDIRFKKESEARPEVRGLVDRDDIHVREDLKEAAKLAISEVLEHSKTVAGR